MAPLKPTANQIVKKVQPKLAGQIAFTGVTGLLTWWKFRVPSWVTQISVVAVGGGGSGVFTTGTNRRLSGAGGGLRYINNLNVTPGEVLLISVGGGGVGRTSAGTGSAGLATSLYKQVAGTYQLVFTAGGGGGGSVTTSTTTVATAGAGTTLGSLTFNSQVLTVGGGNGGAGVNGATNKTTGGAGAGGYSGNGGVGGIGNGSSGGIPTAGTGAGAGGAGSSNANNNPFSGGGVGLYGNTGTATASSQGGSGGTSGSTTLSGVYGGGGYSRAGTTSAGGNGAIRIVWAGIGATTRTFPTTNVGTDLNQGLFSVDVELLSNNLTTLTSFNYPIGFSTARHCIVGPAGSGGTTGAVSNAVSGGGGGGCVLVKDISGISGKTFQASGAVVGSFVLDSVTFALNKGADGGGNVSGRALGGWVSVNSDTGSGLKFWSSGGEGGEIVASSGTGGSSGGGLLKTNGIKPIDANGTLPSLMNKSRECNSGVSTLSSVLSSGWVHTNTTVSLNSQINLNGLDNSAHLLTDSDSLNSGYSSYTFSKSGDRKVREFVVVFRNNSASTHPWFEVYYDNSTYFRFCKTISGNIYTTQSGMTGKIVSYEVNKIPRVSDWYMARLRFINVPTKKTGELRVYPSGGLESSPGSLSASSTGSLRIHHIGFYDKVFSYDIFDPSGVETNLIQTNFTAWSATNCTVASGATDPAIGTLAYTLTDNSSLESFISTSVPLGSSENVYEFRLCIRPTSLSPLTGSLGKTRLSFTVGSETFNIFVPMTDATPFTVSNLRSNPPFVDSPWSPALVDFDYKVLNDGGTTVAEYMELVVKLRNSVGATSVGIKIYPAGSYGVDGDSNRNAFTNTSFVSSGNENGVDTRSFVGNLNVFRPVFGVSKSLGFWDVLSNVGYSCAHRLGAGYGSFSVVPTNFGLGTCGANTGNSSVNISTATQYTTPITTYKFVGMGGGGAGTGSSTTTRTGSAVPLNYVHALRLT